MKLIAVDRKEYNEVISAPLTVFHSAAFNLLNEHKCYALHFFLFKETKFRLGLIAGLKDGVLASPFSAPYGGFVPVGGNIRIEHYLESVNALLDYSANNRINSVKLSLPPVFYDSAHISRMINALHVNNFSVSGIDLNHYLPLTLSGEEYEMYLSSNGRRNLKLSQDAGLQFHRCKNTREYEEAYNIIKENRKQAGFPLHLSFEEVLNTAELLPADFFVVIKEDKLIASAIVFRVTPKVAQIIYWGDLAAERDAKSMNYLAFELFKFFRDKGFDYLDIGPSTEDSIPNFGLCEFKESIGCQVSPKFSFIRKV